MPPRTIDAGIVPGPSVSFVWPPGVELTPESVFAEIDATAAGATTATLTIADGSGAVIAKVRQGEAVDAGSAGSATWALRLADEQGAVTPTADPFELFFSAAPTLINPGATAALTWTHSGGALLLNTATFPTNPDVLDAGIYAFTLTVVVASVPLAPYTILVQFQTGLGGTSSVYTTRAPYSVPQAFNAGVEIGATRAYAQFDSFRVNVAHTSAAAQRFLLDGSVQKLG